MSDERDQRIDRQLAERASRFDASHGWAGRQDAGADFVEVARLAGIDIASSRRANRKRVPNIVGKKRAWFAYGTAAVLLAAIGVFAWPRWQPGVSDTPARATTEQRFVTARAQQATVQLSDGSQVTLAPDSRLQFTLQPDGSRVAALHGQAYFIVTADPHRPFVVTTGDVSTKVLGTSFSVRAYETDRATQVAVATGKVAVSIPAAPALLLNAGEVGHVLTGKPPLPVRDASMDALLGWIRGDLAFDAVPLSDVARELERRYDVRIRIDDAKLAGRQFTMMFRNPSLTEVLDVIAPTIGARYVRHGNDIVFSPRS